MPAEQSIPGKTEKKKKDSAAYRTAVSQGIKLALYLISVCLADLTKETEGMILPPELHDIKEC